MAHAKMQQSILLDGMAGKINYKSHGLSVLRQAVYEAIRTLVEHHRVCHVCYHIGSVSKGAEGFSNLDSICSGLGESLPVEVPARGLKREP